MDEAIELEPGVASQSEPTGPKAWARLNATRIAGGVFFGLCLLALLLPRHLDPVLALLIFPVCLGALVLLASRAQWNSKIDGWAGWFLSKQEKAGAGKWGRFIAKPCWSTCSGIWDRTRRIPEASTQAAVRVTILALLTVLVAAVAISVGLVVAIVAAALLAIVGVFWLIAQGASGNNKPRRSESADAAEQRAREAFAGLSARKAAERSSKKTTHRDASGNYAGSSREEVGIFGDKRTVNRDASGNYAGTSREEDGILSGKRTVHRDASGNYAGSSRDEHGILGGERTVHRDASGNYAGSSREEEGSFGDKRTVHRDSSGEYKGESKSN